eukprot:2557954-Pleurochrysis_carterae.AAC.5
MGAGEVETVRPQTPRHKKLTAMWTPVAATLKGVGYMSYPTAKCGAKATAAASHADTAARARLILLYVALFRRDKPALLAALASASNEAQASGSGAKACAIVRTLCRMGSVSTGCVESAMIAQAVHELTVARPARVYARPSCGAVIVDSSLMATLAMTP